MTEEKVFELFKTLSKEEKIAYIRENYISKFAKPNNYSIEPEEVNVSHLLDTLDKLNIYTTIYPNGIFHMDVFEPVLDYLYTYYNMLYSLKLISLKDEENHLVLRFKTPQLESQRMKVIDLFYLLLLKSDTYRQY